MADAATPAPDRWCALSAKPELAPRTAAAPGSPGITPLGAARSTKGGTGRRCLGRGDAAPELPGTEGQLNSVTSPYSALRQLLPSGFCGAYPLPRPWLGHRGPHHSRPPVIAALQQRAV